MFSPESKTGEFFGLWGLSGKLAAAFGLFALSWLQTILSLESSFFVIGIFFALSLGINFFVNEKRGREIAKNYKEDSY
jgi:UMF1 family MFS transporter